MPRFVLSEAAEGDLRDDLADETLRVWTVNSYVVIYRPDAQPLQVVRVRSGHRDIAVLP